MAATTELDPVGAFFEERFKTAYELFHDGDPEAANKIACELLNEPALGDLHRAGMHLLLAHSPEDYVDHAERAVELYKYLYTDTDKASRKQLDSQRVLLRAAEEALRRAKKTAEEYPTIGTETEADVRAMVQDAEDEAAEAAAIEAANIKAAEAAKASGVKEHTEGSSQAVVDTGGEGRIPGPSLLQLSQQEQGMEGVLATGEAGPDGEDEDTVFLPVLAPTPPPTSPGH